MNLKVLKKPLLLELANSLGLKMPDQTREPAIIEAIEALEADDDELSECLELIEEREKSEREAEDNNEKSMAEKSKLLVQELEFKRIELQLLKARNESDGSVASSGVECRMVRMKDLMKAYRKGEDMGLFLVNFERTCEKSGYFKATWPQCLLTLLPCEATDVITCLTKEDADDYGKVKFSMLKKYRLSERHSVKNFAMPRSKRTSHIQTSRTSS